MDEVPAMDTYDELEVEELPPLQVQTERKEPSTEQINTESLPLTGQKRRYTIMERD